MRNFFKKRSRLLIGGIIIITLTCIIDNLGDKLTLRLAHSYHKRKIQEEVIYKENLINSCFSDFKNSTLDETYADFNKYIELSAKDHILLYIYHHGQLLLWTNNKVLPNMLSYFNNTPFLQNLDNGNYLQIIENNKDYTYIGLIPVQSNYPITNRYLKNSIQLGKDKNPFKLNSGIEIHDQGYNIVSNEGKFLFSLESNTKYPKHDGLVYFYLFGFFLLFIFINKEINKSFAQQHFVKGIIIFLSTLIIIIILWKIIKVPTLLFKQSLFKPEIYASSYFFSSLGNLLISTLLFAWLINLVTKWLTFNLPQKNLFQFLYGMFVFSLTILLTLIIAQLISGLVINSNIALDIRDFFSFDSYTLLTFIIIFLLFYAIIKLLFFLFKKIDKFYFSFLYWLVVVLIPLILCYFLSKTILDIDIIHLTYPIFIWILFYFSHYFEKFNYNFIITLIIISAAFSSYQFILSNLKNEEENRKHLITSIATDRDIIGEELIKDIILKIKNDNYIRRYFYNPFLPKSQLHKRIKQLYLTGYFSKYDFEIYTYSSKGIPFKSQILRPIENFIEIIKNGQEIDKENGIYFINTFDGAPGYIIHLPIRYFNQQIGQIIIELKRKPFLEESVYPELLVEGNVKRAQIFKDYSFAIYKNNNLSNQKGEYSYPLTFFYKNNLKNSYHFFNKDQYSHLVFTLNDNILIVLSKEVDNIFYWLSLFSAIFILSAILISSVFFFNRVRAKLIGKQFREIFFLIFRNPFRDLSFKSKIQLTILATIIIALGLTGYFTISYQKKKSHENAILKLREEIGTASKNLDNYLKENSPGIFRSTNEELYAKIKNLADLFKSDINIFDIYGNLITSSQMSIYERKIISEKMDAKAYYHLTILQNSQLVQNEKIGGLITYLSIYSPIRNKENKIFAFINLPYLAGEKELRQEISSLIITTVNLYMFLFLLMILISILISNAFTAPLEMIGNNIRELQLGRINRKISWKSNDEIGQLIDEYNMMVTKVEESAKALAKSERESAWREMAKQVAHEIKNPLTPMKLNIQQLIRAWEDKVPDIDERFKKVTNILINRIDTLSEIATEFSVFARMPEAKNDIIIIEKILKEVVYLFSNTENVKLFLNLSTDETKIYADESQLIRAFNNIIKNSIQAIPKKRKGIIDIRTVVEDEQLKVIIEDNGIGIPAQLHDKIFLPNFSTKSSGMGLGLAIVSRIIKSANGNIGFKTEEDKGTKFFISFPLYKEK